MSTRSINAGSTDGQASKELKSDKTDQLGYFSNHGWEAKRKMFGGKGPVEPKVNQDRIFITPKVCGKDGAWIFSVYDGNGPKGHHVSQAAGDAMVAKLEKPNGVSALCSGPPVVAKCLTSSRPTSAVMLQQCL